MTPQVIATLSQRFRNETERDINLALQQGLDAKEEYLKVLVELDGTTRADGGAAPPQTVISLRIDDAHRIAGAGMPTMAVSRMTPIPACRADE